MILTLTLVPTRTIIAPAVSASARVRTHTVSLSGKDVTMLLAIDVGNTNTVIGVYDGDRRVGIWRIRTLEDVTADEYRIVLTNLAQIEGVGLFAIDGAIIACVVPPLIRAL